MKQNLLLEYREKLAADITKLCSDNRFDNNTVFKIKKSSSSVFANITEAQYHALKVRKSSQGMRRNREPVKVALRFELDR